MSFDLKYSSSIKESKCSGYSKIYRFARHNDLVSNFPEGSCKSLWDCFLRGRKVSGDAHQCLGTRRPLSNGEFGPYEWKTFGQMHSEIQNLASGLLCEDAAPMIEFPSEPKLKNLRFLALYSKNREEWLMCDYACALLGAAGVPLYDTLGPDSTVFILNQTKLTTVCGSVECLTKLADLLNQCPCVKLLVCFDKVPDDLISKASAANVKVCKYSDVVKTGKENPKQFNNKAEYDSLATICYTSGTTGTPKGVMLCHSNFISTMAAAVEGPLKWPGIEISSTDKHISYLPLAHVFERIFIHLCINRGCKVGFYAGDTLKLLDDIKMLQPTVFISVPRLFGRINDKVAVGLGDKSSLAQWMFNRGLRSKLDKMRRTGVASDMFWDGMVFKKTKTLMGGKIRYMINGGAPLDPDVQETMSALFCAPLVSGYGMTETTGASWIGWPGDPAVGHVGAVFPCLEFKLQTVTEMNYNAEDEVPRGELLCRGPAIFSGYFQNPEETEAVFDADGWYHTGDIAEIDRKHGGLRIIDRKKNIFKLAQGEYVAPEKIEGVYSIATILSQIFVTGKSTESFLVAIVVPDEALTLKWAEQNGMSGTSFRDVCRNTDFQDHVAKQMNEAATVGRLLGYEKVMEFVLEPEPFSVENNLLTPTFKIKRIPARDKYENQISEMYQKKK